MFDQNLSLIQPGGRFNIIWIAGDPVKKKLSAKLRKRMASRDLDVIVSQLRPYVFNLRSDVEFNKALLLPLNVAYRLVCGTLRFFSVNLDDIAKKLKDLTSVEIRLLHAREEFLIPDYQISKVLFEDEHEIEEEEETVLVKKRKYEDTYEEDIGRMLDEDISIYLGDLRIREPISEHPAEVSRLPPTIKGIEGIGDREKRKREFTELFDVISEVGRTNEDVIEVAREAFAVNPILSEAFERRISGVIEGLEECYDLILDSKAAQTDFYLQKLKLVDQNVINDERIAQASKQSGRRYSIRADTVLPSDIYSELTSIAQGKGALQLPSSAFRTLREEGYEETGVGVPQPGELSFVQEVPEVTMEEPIVPPLEKELPVQPEIVEPVETPAIQRPIKRRRIPRAPGERQRPPRSLDVVLSIKTLDEIFRFFNQRQAISSSKLNGRIRSISKACEKLVDGLAKQREVSVQECLEFNFWFKSLENVSEEVYNNNGYLMNMFERLKSLPFVLKGDGFTVGKEYRNELKKILNRLKTFEVNYALYAAIVDMPIIGLSNDICNREIIDEWLRIPGLDSGYSGPGGKKYSFIPKFLPKYTMHPDFTYSLRTLRHPYEKLKYPFLKKIGQNRNLYLRGSKIALKKIKKFMRNDIGSWDFNKDKKVIEKMIKDVILSDNVLTSKFYNLQSLTGGEEGIPGEVVNTFSYNPNGTIVWSDLTLFVDYLFKVYCEIEDEKDIVPGTIKQFANELYRPSKRESLVEEEFRPVEFESRLQEINDSLNSVFSEPENYFYNKSNEKVNSRFESLMPMIGEDETSIFDDIDMKDIVDELETFELDLLLGYIPPQIEVEEKPQEESNFDKAALLYKAYVENKEDLVIKQCADSKFLIPSKWEEKLLNYASKSRKRSFYEPPSLQEKPKRQRVSGILPTIPEEGVPSVEGEGGLEEISVLPRVEEARRIEKEFTPGSLPSSLGSLTLKPINEEELSHIEEEPMEIETIPEEVTLPLSPVIEGQEKEWADITLPPPEVSETLPQPSALEVSAIDEKRKEVEEILRRPDVVPEYQFTFSRTDFRFDGEKKGIPTTDNEYLNNAARQIGFVESVEEEGGISPDYEMPSEISDFFGDISLLNYIETSTKTYEKAKRLAGDSGKTTFKELVKDCPTRPCVAKTFYNMVLLARGKRNLDISQKYPEDIEIKIGDSPTL
uniref:Rad21/Rec8-like protein N-terminal domain-containing protein n=1 Tax=Strongyloides stercoralis TaxID=6248 RepID=A0AAF5CUB7_STRER